MHGINIKLNVLFRFSRDKYIEKTRELKKALESRVCEMAEEERNIALFTNPFLLPEGKIYDMNSKTQIMNFKFNPQMKSNGDQLCAVSKR
jgi:hypothetical protein